MNENELLEVRKLLDAAEGKIRLVKTKLFASELSKKATLIEDIDEDDFVSGVFDGELMIGNDKKEYQVPANYASKSKLVPGDMLKLIVTDSGKFIFKQIGPVPRKNLVGTLEELDDGSHQVDVNGKKYQVLTASITFFKAKTGDKISIVVPAEEESAWAAVDNII